MPGPSTPRPTLESISSVAKRVAVETTADAMRLDGQPFTGPVVAARLGEIMAGVVALAECIDALADHLYERSR